MSIVKNEKVRFPVRILGVLLAMSAVISGLILTFVAAGATGVNVFIQTRWDLFLLIWHYNPLAYLVVTAVAVLGGFFVVLTWRR